MSVGELGSASAVAAALLLALAAVLGLRRNASTPAAVCATAGSAALIVLGLAWLSERGIRYPFPPYGTQCDPAAAFAVNYAGKL